MDRVNCKNSCSRLDVLLTGLIQMFQQIYLLDLQKPESERNPVYEHFLNILMKGVELVNKCEKTSVFNIFHHVRYASQIQQLEKEISDFLHYQMPLSVLLDVKNLITELKSFRDLHDLRSMDESKMNETISKLSNDSLENAMMLQKMRADDMFDGAFVEAPCSYDGLVKSDSVVGLQKNIWNLKRILLQKDVSVVGVKGMGGAGKTTMAWALCNDKEIKDAMEENQWRELNFSETEALVLLFSASQYFLPSFVSSMKKLKVLIVYNYGSKRATVNGLPALSSLTKLKTLHLERLIVPPLQEHSKVLQKLQKLSLSLCEGLGTMSRFNSTQSSLKFPIMLDFNLDHCCDLEELPPSICDMSSVQKWSITNCHLLQKLPDHLGKLSFLRILSVSACLGLKELPASIGKLGKLEYLDISLCECLKELPEEIGQLNKLEELDMRECSRFRKLPKSVGGLRSLKHVVCDEKIGNQWSRVKSSAIMELRVEVVEAHFSLDWLDAG